jgi:hypothetical protein
LYTGYKSWNFSYLIELNKLSVAKAEKIKILDKAVWKLIMGAN